MSVTIVTCHYGAYRRFLTDWAVAVAALDPQPADVVIAGDWECPWQHPQAHYLNQAIAIVHTEWVWIHDIDDTAHPDALKGLEYVAADVWQMGYSRSDGEEYIVPQLTNAEYLALDHNPYVAASAIRTEAFREVGGFRDIALQDWGLWRRMARQGFTFESSGRTHFTYNRHSETRGATELTMDRRPGHLAEMFESEESVVA